MARPNVLVLTGYGINCEEETAFAFKKAGAKPRVVHVNDLIDRVDSLGNYQVLAIPGGFSYGDDTGSGYAMANKLRNHLWEEVLGFVQSDKLAIGICNGFQVMVNLGLLPAENGYGRREVALLHNDSARYTDRWVDLEFRDKGPWTEGIGTISVPVAHGEGKLYAPPQVLKTLKSNGHIAARYIQGNMCSWLDLPANPNGSLEDIAALQDSTGRVIGMMPHPERAIEFAHLPNWTYIREVCKRKGQDVPTEGPGLKLFRNAVEYFS